MILFILFISAFIFSFPIFLVTFLTFFFSFYILQLNNNYNNKNSSKKEWHFSKDARDSLVNFKYTWQGVYIINWSFSYLFFSPQVMSLNQKGKKNIKKKVFKKILIKLIDLSLFTRKYLFKHSGNQPHFLPNRFV